MEWSRGRLLVYVIQAGAGDAMTDKKTPDEALDGIDESKRRILWDNARNLYNLG